MSTSFVYIPVKVHNRLYSSGVWDTQNDRIAPFNSTNTFTGLMEAIQIMELLGPEVFIWRDIEGVSYTVLADDR